MRFLHTADWHLGRSLGEHPLLEDQAAILRGQFVDIVRDTKPDAVLVAGDIFDRAVPPAEAVELLDDVLHAIVRGLGVPVVVIPGNHDAAARLSFGARLLARGGLHIADSPLGQRIVIGRDGEAPVDVVALPYVTPLALAAQAAGEAFADHDAGHAWLAPLLHGLCEPSGRRRVLVAHAFVMAGEPCESERGLAVGGSGQVQANRFDGFDYVALGHLHRPQTLGDGRLRYSGSPLAYSKSEAGQDKSVSLVELDAAGALRLETIPLRPRRLVRAIEGTLAALLAAPPGGAEDFLYVTLTDPVPAAGAQRRLAERHPHIVNLRHAVAARGPESVAGGPGATTPFELFAAFHVAMRGQPLDAAARPAVVAAIAAASAG